jgi:3D (Asp-Asp-Asp) domain-containing protein
MTPRRFSREHIIAQLGGSQDTNYDPRKTLYENAGLQTPFGNDDTDVYGSDAGLQTEAGNCPNGSITVSMMVTAYTSGPESTGKRPGDPAYGITASGATAGPGTIAAPGNYAFGTRMYVPGYGWGTVEDRGGAIRGNALDVWYETVEEARQWGRQTLNVIVCKG